MNPLSPSVVVCPNCNAQPGNPCTQPTDNGRTAVNWFHFSREDHALYHQEND